MEKNTGFSSRTQFWQHCESVKRTPAPKIKTCPELVASVAASLGVDVKSVASHGVQLGNRVEINLTSLSESGHHDLAVTLGDMWAQMRKGDLSNGSITGTRTLYSASQKDSKSGKADLVAEIELMRTFSGLSVILDDMLTASPDWDAIRVKVAGMEGTVAQDGNNTVVTVKVDSRIWPLPLGGPASPAEQTRTVTLKVNHAKWRDRKNRRLVAMTVTATETWPKPVV